MGSDSTTVDDAQLTAADRAYLELRRRILDNEMPAGYQAFEQEVADSLQVSRTPAREAMNRLVNDGLVEVRPRRGLRVLPISVEDMREIYQILTALESMAAELLARRGVSDSEAAQLQQAIASMDSALASGDLQAWAEADENFHLMLVRMCGNRRLAEQVSTYWTQSHRVRLLTLKLRPKPTQSNRDHRAVVKAILAGDAEAAGAHHRQHRIRTGDLLVSLLDQYNLTAL